MEFLYNGFDKNSVPILPMLPMVSNNMLTNNNNNNNNILTNNNNNNDNTNMVTVVIRGIPMTVHISNIGKLYIF